MLFIFFVKMIIWISSYPKSGNTYLRSFLSAYYFSKDGKFDFDLLLNIHQFPGIKFFEKKINNKTEASKNWILSQEKFFDKKKIHFLKTHNCLIPFNGNDFTTQNQTIGVIYIVRDPRNLITSLTHHYSLEYYEALDYMLDEDKGLLEKAVDNDHSNFAFVSSWSNHYKSWINNNTFKTMVIKYEELENNKYEIFRDVIIFINTLSKKNISVDKEKLLNSIQSTNFVNLRNKEENQGFEESVFSKKTGKKLRFFNLGFNNRWQKILPEEIKIKVNNTFKNDLKFFKYN